MMRWWGEGWNREDPKQPLTAWEFENTWNNPCAQIFTGKVMVFKTTEERDVFVSNNSLKKRQEEIDIMVETKTLLVCKKIECYYSFKIMEDYTPGNVEIKKLYCSVCGTQSLMRNDQFQSFLKTKQDGIKNRGF